MGKLGIVLGTNELSALLYAAMNSVISTSLGDDVGVFVTMDGVLAFKRESEIKTSTKSSLTMTESPFDLFGKAKKTGKLKVYACSYASSLLKLSRSDYSELVDNVAGITTFMIEFEDGKLLSVW